MVQAVVALLLTVSVISWAAIFRKVFALKCVQQLTEVFERDFWSGASLSDLYLAATRNAHQGSPMERIFASGMREFQKLREKRISDADTLLGGAPRDARELPARGRCAGGQPGLPGLGRIGLALCRAVRHRLGHHARLHRPGRADPGHAGDRGAGHRRGAGGDRDRPLQRFRP